MRAVSATFGHASIASAGVDALPGEFATRLLEAMLVARTLEDRIAAAGRLDSAGTRGWEATIVGAAAGMQGDDFLVLGPETIAAALWRSIPLIDVARRRLGLFRVDDPRGSPSAFRPARVVDSSPLPGRRIPHAVGLAWAARLRKTPVATLAFFDVGATSGGDFHAGLNIAGVVRAPLVSVCLTSPSALAAQTASDGVSIKALAYGLRGVRVDATDALAVMTQVREARAEALAGGGGTLVEAVVAGSDATDPIVRLRATLEAGAMWSPEREPELVARAAHEIDRALADAADDRPGMPRDAFFDQVYAELPWHLQEQKRSLSSR
jgi:TPP-dependent pyruvate/acetoin dehydrogenase alpha subunit